MAFGFQSIQNNSSSLFGINNANKSRKGLGSALEKLSSGFKVNQASDGPSALVISELLRSQLSGMYTAVQNTQEANNVLSIAEGGLSQIQEQLRSARGLAVHALNSGITSASQISADQSALNGSLNAISNIAATTKFSDQFLLNGSQSVTFSADDPNNLIDTQNTTIDSYSDATGLRAEIQFSGDQADQAERATLETDLGGGTTLSGTQSFSMTGTNGASYDFTFEAGTSIQQAADTINARSDETGVTAYATDDTGAGPTELRLASSEYGSDQTIRIQQTTGDLFASQGSIVSDTGQDAVISVDGQEVTGDGLTFEVETSNFNGTLAFNAGSPAATTIAQTGYDQDTVTDASTEQSASVGSVQGGMQLQLGEGAASQNRTNFGIGGASLNDLGRVNVDGQTYSLRDIMSGGDASLANNPEIAIQVIDQAISDISSQRAQIGAFQANTLTTNANSLNVAIENITATESGIRDSDIAKQITEMTKYQILEEASILAIQSANTNRSRVLELLGG